MGHFWQKEKEELLVCSRNPEGHCPQLPSLIG
jgi:hypothetical protein